MRIPKTLIAEYKNKKKQIKQRLGDFSKLHNAKEEDIFRELCFCLFTPGSKAVNGDRAVKDLISSGLLFNGTRFQISKRIRGVVRFHNNKASYLVEARKLFKNGDTVDMKRKLNAKDVFNTREWLVKNVKGLGYKEASHFLRNIGLGHDISILDTHILKNLKRYQVISEIPESISRVKYLDIEEKMRKFSKKIKIPLGELDLLFWSHETGYVFK